MSVSLSPLAAAAPPTKARVRAESLPAAWFAAACALVVAASAVWAGSAPIAASIVTVFLFAGPHNWLEARYFLQRMPGRWGPLRGYFLTGLSGTLLLSAAFAAIPWMARSGGWGPEGWAVALATWNTALVAWVGLLAWMRSRQNPRRDWSWLAPLGGGLVALAWLCPAAWDLGLVYLHPLVALAFLDRELGRRHAPALRRAYRAALWLVPAGVALLVAWLADRPSLPGDDALSARIAHHAGASILQGVSTHLLVSIHVFLETLHYAVWIVAIPLVGLGRQTWRPGEAPLARRGVVWRRGVGGVVALGGVVAVVLWGGFLADYPLTRDIYFTVALLHVLAEAPFLLRLL